MWTGGEFSVRVVLESKLGTLTNGNPQAPSSALAVLGTLQPRPFGLL